MNINQKKLKRLIRESIKRNLINELVDGPISWKGGARAGMPGALNHFDPSLSNAAMYFESTRDNAAMTGEQFEEKILNIYKTFFTTAISLACPQAAAIFAAGQVAHGAYIIYESYNEKLEKAKSDKMFEDGTQEIVGAMVGLGFSKAVTGPIIKAYFDNPGASYVRKKVGERVEQFMGDLFGALTQDVTHQIVTGETGHSFKDMAKKDNLVYMSKDGEKIHKQYSDYLKKQKSPSKEQKEQKEKLVKAGAEILKAVKEGKIKEKINEKINKINKKVHNASVNLAKAGKEAKKKIQKKTKKDSSKAGPSKAKLSRMARPDEM